MSSSATILGENHGMSYQHDDVIHPVMFRKWRVNVLQPEAGVEVEMKLPKVSQDEFDLILMYWHLYEVDTTLKLFHILF